MILRSLRLSFSELNALSRSSSSTADARAGQPLRWKEPENRNEEVVVQEGQAAVLSCRAVGYPDPRVRWMHSYQDKPAYDNQFEMTLENARLDNAGTWTCVVSSQCSEYGARELRFNVKLIVSSTRLCRASLALPFASRGTEPGRRVRVHVCTARATRRAATQANGAIWCPPHCSKSCAAFACLALPIPLFPTTRT